MNIKELKKELAELGISDKEYSLEGDLISDRVILSLSYNKWNVFYLDERGGRNKEKVFDSECEACWYVYKLFRDLKRIESKFKK